MERSRYRDVMLDLETLGLSPRAPIVTVALVAFDFRDGVSADERDRLYVRVQLQSYNAHRDHFQLDYDTLAWWLNQHAAPLREALGGPARERVPVADAMQQVHRFLTERFNTNTVRVWSHGKDFDTVLLGDTLRHFDLGVPWRYWNTRDTRTVYDLFGELRVDNPPAAPHQHHHAMHDCRRQVERLVRARAQCAVFNDDDAAAAAPME